MADATDRPTYRPAGVDPLTQVGDSYMQVSCCASSNQQLSQFKMRKKPEKCGVRIYTWAI